MEFAIVSRNFVVAISHSPVSAVLNENLTHFGMPSFSSIVKRSLTVVIIVIYIGTKRDEVFCLLHFAEGCECVEDGMSIDVLHVHEIL